MYYNFCLLAKYIFVTSYPSDKVQLKVTHNSFTACPSTQTNSNHTSVSHQLQQTLSRANSPAPEVHAAFYTTTLCIRHINTFAQNWATYINLIKHVLIRFCKFSSYLDRSVSYKDITACIRAQLGFRCFAPDLFSFTVFCVYSYCKRPNSSSGFMMPIV